MAELCDSWTNVDFGEGAVKIRCTRTGEHIQHNTHVVWQDDSDNIEMRD